MGFERIFPEAIVDFPGAGQKSFFQRGETVVKFQFTTSHCKTFFSSKTVNSKYRIGNSKGKMNSCCPPLSTPMFTDYKLNFSAVTTDLENQRNVINCCETRNTRVVRTTRVLYNRKSIWCLLTAGSWTRSGKRKCCILGASFRESIHF